MTVLSTGKGKAGCIRVSKPRYPALPFFYVPRTRSRFQKERIFISIITILLIFAADSAGAQELSPLPVIPRLDSRDTVFKQYLQDVEAARRLLFSASRYQPGAAAELAASLTIYSYTPREDDEMLGIAARCSLPYSTLASLNRISHGEEMVSGKLLLLPSIPGIFIPESPGNDLERLLTSARAGEEKDNGVIISVPREGRTERFKFIPGDDFSPTERVFFLHRGFHFPLQNFRVSSFYGPRINPVTGKPGVHGGLDLAAPEGSEVYAVRSGTVVELGEDPVLGKYIIISHENNWVSLYGHLSSINTALHAELQSASLIGRVGSTGQSTGPHLHFELRQNGQSRDPARLLGLFKGGP